MNIKHIIIFAAVIILSNNALYGQNSDELKDFDFVVQQIEVNYAGFPTTTDTIAYRSLKERLRNEVLKDKRKGYMAAAELIGWFGDEHLRLGAYSQKYSTHRKTKSRSNNYNPEPIAQKIDDRTFLIRVPSFDDTKEEIDSAVKSYRASGCPNLVIDIRGNGGGLDEAYLSLRALLYDRPSLIYGVEFRNTPEHRQLIKDLAPTNDWAEQLALAMEQSDAAFYPISDSTGKWTLKYDSIEKFPIKAAVIIDDAVASSGEQFVLDVRASSGRSTIYGQDNTLGCLDYSNARPVNLPYSKLTMYVPISRSCRLPDRAIDKTGIAPDKLIKLPYPKKLTDNIDSWVKWVSEDLQKI